MPTSATSLDFSVHAHPACVALRFPLDRGVVWALVRVEGDEAGVGFFEQEAAVSGGGTAQMEAARNRFGAGRMLRVCRAVVGAFPTVRRWHFERVTGAGPAGRRVREV